MQLVRIKSIKKLPEKLDRYDLTVNTTHNFYANHILIHNTSAIIGNIKVKEPKYKEGFFGKLYSKYFCYLPSFLQKTTEKYAIVPSSRAVIIDNEINPDRGIGFAGGAVQRNIAEYAMLIGKYIPKDITIYGEIVGYYSGTATPIQTVGNGYDYGCRVGENQLMIYRIVDRNKEGIKFDYNVNEVKALTLRIKDALQEDGYVEAAARIRPIDMLYHGKLADLYPDLDTTNHWHENLLARLKEDKQFGMEEYEPFCKNKVYREGIVIRKDYDVVPEAFKLKCLKFLGKEAEKMDKGELDAEMEERY